MKTKITIVVPIYNVAQYLEQCVDSIVKEVERADEPGVEVILVDDGATDGSGNLADQLALGHPYIRVIHQENMGVAAARNRGMDRALGEWIYFMDGDDWLAEGALVAIRRAVHAYPDSDMILFDAYKSYESKRVNWEHFPQACVWEHREEIQRLQRSVLYYPKEFPQTEVPLAAPWDKIYRLAFLRKYNLCFPEELRVLDDMIFNMEVLGRAQKVSYIKTPIYYYRYVSDSITNCYKRDRIGQDAKVWQYIEKYMDLSEEMQAGNGKESEEFKQSYYCRIIKSFAIALRLNLYHRKNGKMWLEKQRNVKDLLQREPYREAFCKVKVGRLEWKLQMLVLAVRGRQYLLLYLFYLAQNYMIRC